MARENRVSNRKSSQITISELDGDYQYLHNATNVSEGGIYIETSTPYRAPSKEITLSVLTPKHSEVKFKGEIVHSDTVDNKATGFGIKFTDFEKGSSQDLIELTPK